MNILCSNCKANQDNISIEISCNNCSALLCAKCLFPIYKNI